ncbi:hypothetical protein [Nocardioides sp. W7]|uniref:hypothetical protein n=1 Tax=Nocardioides sp. W7 TaxID=2931390 RepID=UPI001FD3B1D5|nr:hypothetical protein [Nocardioides sp. W7]
MTATPHLAPTVALRVLGRALRFRWPVIVAVLLPAVVLGVGAVEIRSSPAVAVSVVGVGPEDPELTNADTVRLALGRYSVLIGSAETLSGVASATGVPVRTLETAVEIVVSQDAGNLAVRVTLPTEEKAREVAQEVAERAVAISAEDNLADAAVLSAARVERPGLLGSKRALQAVLLLVALVVAVGAAYVLELTRGRIRTGGDAAEAAGGPLLGNLPGLTRSRFGRGEIASDDAILDSARSLRSGWAAADRSAPPGPVLVVGTEPEAGATTVAYLLARTLSDRGASAIVLDLDLDRAGLSRRVGESDALRLTDVLSGHCTLAEAVHHEGGVAVLRTEPLSDAGDLLDRRLPDVLAEAAQGWDVVLCDTTPLGAGEISEIVAPHAASAVVVVRLGSTRADAERTAARLTRLGLPIRGVVLNGATRAAAETPGLVGAGDARG